MIEQNTLGGSLTFEGVGLHTGARTAIELRPAAADTGLVFAISHGGGHTRVPALAEYVVDTSRATVLGRDGVTVSTTEHLLSALFAMGVSNAEIVVDGPEIPVLDGSARVFADAIAAAGVVAQGRLRAVVAPEEPFAVTDGERMVAIVPSEEFRVRFVADFPAPIGTQYFYGAVDGSTFREEIAAARTFGYLHEVEALRARGLAMGGSLENALVFAPDGPMQPLRWPNEVVRHKVLDLIGDLALLGAWPRCEIVAIKSGHEMHARLTRSLRERLPVPSEAS